MAKVLEPASRSEMREHDPIAAMLN